MWKKVIVVLAVLLGLGAGNAEARFGKRSRPSSPPPSSPSEPAPAPSPSPTHPSSGVGTTRPNPNPYHGRDPFYGHGYLGFYGDPWYRYYYDPAWAWPFIGPYHPFYGQYYDLRWQRRRLMPRPSVQVDRGPEQPTRVDISADAGFVSEGYSMALGLQADGELLGFGARLNMFNLATDDGSPGRDHISLLSLRPGVLLVSHENLRVRLSGGLEMAFAPDVIFVGPGLGTSALVRLLGPVKLEASALWTPLPFTQFSGDAGLAVDLGKVRLRGGYRATYLNDQGRVDGYVNSDLFSGPYAGLALLL